MKLNSKNGQPISGKHNKTFPSIDPATNRFNPNQGFQYDKNGNLTANADGLSVVFNGENKQAKIIKDGKLVGEYDYNGEGQRVRKRTFDASGYLQDTTVFVYSAGKLVAEYTTAEPPENPTTRYTATDMLGSPRVITDSQGNVLVRRDFKPFGEEITNNTGERQTAAKYGVADNLKQKFTTYQRDDESGLDFAEARMYENRHGRFTTVDPLLASGKSANPKTYNRYIYCANDPLGQLDPSGLQAGGWISRVSKVDSDGTEHRIWVQQRKPPTDEQTRKGFSKLTAPYTATVDGGRRDGWQVTFFPNGSIRYRREPVAFPPTAEGIPGDNTSTRVSDDVDRMSPSGPVWPSPRPINQCSSMFGLSYSGIIGAGDGFSGLVATGSIAGLIETNGGNSRTVLAPSLGGAYQGTFSPVLGFPEQNRDFTAIGFTFGGGPGLVSSNAKEGSALTGPFEAEVYATPIISVIFETDPKTGTKVTSFGGPSVSAGYFRFRTNTFQPMVAEMSLSGCRR